MSEVVMPDWALKLRDGKIFNKRNAVILLLCSGGLSYVFRHWYKDSKKGSTKKHYNVKRRDRVNIDAAFFRRLLKILKIIVPSASSPEAFYLVALSAMLIARIWFSLMMATIIGRNARSIVSRDWAALFNGLQTFFLTTIPAAFINCSLKWLADKLSCLFRRRLSEHVNNEYVKGVNFYTVCNLNLGGDDRLENVDQRVTVDIYDFSTALAQLYTSVFKPVLDVGVFTYQLVHAVGWLGPSILYGYFGFSGWMKQIALKIARYGHMVKHRSKLEGEYRTAHQRLITNSEEIAFYMGADRERILINNSLNTMLDHAAKTRKVKFWVNLADEFLVKYWATMAGYSAISVPLFLDGTLSQGKSDSEMTYEFTLYSRYLQNLSDSIAALIMMLNQLAGIAGYTSRVYELLKKVELLNSAPLNAFVQMDAEASGISEEDKRANVLLQDIDAWLETWTVKCDKERSVRVAAQKEPIVKKIGGGGEFHISEGSDMRFEDVSIVSPEGRLLVKHLNFEVSNENVMVTGPNGAGKSSLFRIIGELWPLSFGKVSKPMPEDILFVPQKPYLVKGTFRDQIIYPHHVSRMKERNVTDEDLLRFMAIVDPSNKMVTTWNMDAVDNWFFAFSGGQKQRVAMARLFYHRPKYAILDECTSAVSSEVEDELYSTCARIGITLFTVSHREYLKRHHSRVLTFVGEAGAWQMQEITEEDKEKIVKEYKQALKSDVDTPKILRKSKNSNE